MKKTITLSFSVLLLCLITEPVAAMSLSLPNGFIFATSMTTNLIATAVLIPLIIILAIMALKYPSLRYQKQADNNLEPENLDKPIVEVEPKKFENQNGPDNSNLEPLLEIEKQIPQIKQESVAVTETVTRQTNPARIEDGSQPKFIRYAARGLVVAGALLYYVVQQKAQEKKKRKK